MTKISNQYSLTNILTADLANSRLGINNVSPTVALDVTGAGKFSSTIQTGGDISLMNASGDISIKMKDSGGNADRVLTRQASTNNVYIGDIDANGGAAIIRTNGNDAINVTSAGNINLYDQKHQLAFYNAGNFQINFGQYYNGTSQIATNTDGGRLLMVDGGFRFQTFTGGTVNSTVADSERMRITSAGNVGIGYSNPTNKLEVNGTGYFSSTISTSGSVSASGNVQGNTLIANSAIYTYNVQQYYYGSCFTFTPPNMLNSGVDNSNMRMYMVWVWGVNGPTEAGARVWMVAVNGPGTAHTATQLLGRDANGGTGLSISRSSANQLQICSNNNAFIKFVSIMQLNAF